MSENADLAFIENLTSEANEQQLELLDELLRDERVFEETTTNRSFLIDVENSSEEIIDNIEIGRSEEIDIIGDSETASDILEEIYRQAQQVDFSPTTTISEEIVDQGWSSSSTSSSQKTTPVSIVSMVRVRNPVLVAPKISTTTVQQQSRFVHIDHDFGSSRRGRPPGSTNKNKKSKTSSSSSSRREPTLKTKKKRQNREAALRYRLKKRSEKMEKEGELEFLQKRNQYLKNKAYSLKAEVDCLKELLLEIKKAKGI